VRSFHFPPSASQAALPFSFGEALGSVEEYCAHPAKNATMKSVDITFRILGSPGKVLLQPLCHPWTPDASLRHKP
jgi:hypothetical protein